MDPFTAHLPPKIARVAHRIPLEVRDLLPRRIIIQELNSLPEHAVLRLLRNAVRALPMPGEGAAPRQIAQERHPELRRPGLLLRVARTIVHPLGPIEFEFEKPSGRRYSASMFDPVPQREGFQAVLIEGADATAWAVEVMGENFAGDQKVSGRIRHLIPQVRPSVEFDLGLGGGVKRATGLKGWVTLIPAEDQSTRHKLAAVTDMRRADTSDVEMAREAVIWLYGDKALRQTPDPIWG